MNFIVFALLVLAGAVAVWLVWGRRSYHPHPPARATPNLHTVPVSEVIDQGGRSEVHMATRGDVLPGGLTAAMLPVRVDWSASDDHGYLLHDVNAGGNPIAGTTILRSARIPATPESVEFVIVPLDAFGDRGLVTHGMLRFVFPEEDPGVLLGPGGPVAGRGGRFPDLVLSWEAWRPPGVPFDVVHGMDPESFSLTLRAYVGAQRFLEDGLGPRDWYCHPLQLPGGSEGLRELLQVTLTLGDGAGRERIAQILGQPPESVAAEGPGSQHDTFAAWRELHDDIAPATPSDDHRLHLAPEQNNYQTFLRSCATLALYCVNLTTERLTERGVPTEGMRPTQAPTMDPAQPWMKAIARASWPGLFVRAPLALRYMVGNREVVPATIPGMLRDAGLVCREDGGHVVYRYSIRGDTPYGALRDNLIE